MLKMTDHVTICMSPSAQENQLFFAVTLVTPFVVGVSTRKSEIIHRMFYQDAIRPPTAATYFRISQSIQCETVFSRKTGTYSAAEAEVA